MSNLNFQLSAQGLNGIFQAFFAEKPVVFWVRSVDWHQQIYVSEAYEKIWGHSTDQLCEHPLSWRDSIVTPSRKEKEQVLKKCMKNKNSVIFSIHDAKGKLHWIRDSGFSLYDTDGTLMAHAGLAEDITDELNSNNIKKDIETANIATNPKFELLLKIIKQELKLNTQSFANQSLSHLTHKRPVIVNGVSIRISARELDCIQQIFNGLSSKEAAKILNISYRTVEKHLENLRTKFGCKNQMEVIQLLLNAMN